MGFIPGHSQAVPISVNGSATPPQVTAAPGSGRLVIDGTPMRVVTLALAAAAGLAALRWAGFRFNVGI